ncbi:MAG TPA: HIT domain-containing protein [Candidatus Acidoferrales bacterium]|jgi:ATP adenylyltransferase|nr:HIT domain-containing protein [Candidatus Acidoferrales bacterium]
MDYLWTPWRYRYIADVNKNDGCIFCDALKGGDEKARIVLRGELNFIILNAFPYTSGHVMIVPYQHVADLKDCKPEALAEMMRLAQRVERALAAEYKPEGYNLGMNLGRAAGAGVTGHLHMHVLPRWSGDSSFMTTVGETRVVPEDLDTTFEKLRRALAAK